MPHDPTIAIVGVTGAVGAEFIATLDRRNVRVGKLKALASARSAGQSVSFRGQSIVIEELNERSFEGVDIALFSAGSGISKKFAPIAVRSGAVVVDNPEQGISARKAIAPSRGKRPWTFYVLASLFTAYVLALYGPMFCIYILSFQGPDGGLTFPMNGVSLTWFGKVFSGGGIVDIGAAFKRSLALGLVVMVITVVLSVAAGMAFRKPFRGASILFYTAIASLIMPSIITSLGIALEFRLIDDFVNKHGANVGLGWLADGYTTAMGLFTSGLGAHLTWTLPFGLLIMFAIFNRFDGRLEEAARDLGATPWQTFRHVVLPIILPSVVGIGLFGSVYLMPVFLAFVRQHDAFEIGKIMLVTGVAQLIAAPLVTALDGKVDARLLTSFGFALFYLRGVAPKEVKSSDIYWGAMPWIGLQAIMVLLVIAFPITVTGLLDKPVQVDLDKVKIEVPQIDLPPLDFGQPKQ
ncbi:MAG: ABC transporter permease subunit [Streptococcus sp.]|nr:ABC transporter permease subunit [Streptococcus sp.]